MDIKLQQDLDHFFQVYQNNTSEKLHQMLSPAFADSLERELAEELFLFRNTLMNRLNEEFNR